MSRSTGPTSRRTDEAEDGARGKLVRLRLPRRSDRDEYVALLEASRAFLGPWEPRPEPGVFPTPAQRFDGILQCRATERTRRFLLAREPDGAIVGGINLSEIVRGPFQSAYMGYWVGASHARRGYMTEGLQLALGQTFGPLELHRVEANIRPENEASLALVRRAGFRREGFSPRYLKIDGRWCDHERWALLADEWEPLER